MQITRLCRGSSYQTNLILLIPVETVWVTSPLLYAHEMYTKMEENLMVLRWLCNAWKQIDDRVAVWMLYKSRHDTSNEPMMIQWSRQTLDQLKLYPHSSAFDSLHLSRGGATQITAQVLLGLGEAGPRLRIGQFWELPAGCVDQTEVCSIPEGEMGSGSTLHTAAHLSTIHYTAKPGRPATAALWWWHKCPGLGLWADSCKRPAKYPMELAVTFSASQSFMPPL